jgi:adenine specific DNA methylase Mod
MRKCRENAPGNETMEEGNSPGGCGTTVAVAKKLGRKGIYCDQNEVAYNIAKERIEKVRGETI